MTTDSTRYTKVNWDELPDNPKFPRQPTYQHPWATNYSSNQTSRDLDQHLGLEHVSIVFVRIGPGQSGTHHRHAIAEEVHILLEGACQIMVGSEVIEARKFDAIRVPPEELRSLHNHTDSDCWWLIIGAPMDEFNEPGMRAYLAANGYPEAERSGET